jgi:hypothetical protein
MSAACRFKTVTAAMAIKSLQVEWCNACPGGMQVGY